MGPILFILYINDIFLNLEDNKILPFADDPAIIVVVKSWPEVNEKAENKINLIAK